MRAELRHGRRLRNGGPGKCNKWLPKVFTPGSASKQHLVSVGYRAEQGRRDSQLLEAHTKLILRSSYRH